MRTVKTLRPDQLGTKELLTRFGPPADVSGLCVWYRYDEDSRERLKTVELVVERRSQEREADCPGSRTPGTRAGSVGARRVALRIGWQERDLQQQVNSGGSRWDPVRQVWILRREVAERLDLLPRVVGGGG